MTRKKKLAWVSLMIFVSLAAAVPAAFGMYIMKGYLSPVYCVAWGVTCIPFLVLGIRSTKKSLEEDRRNITLFAIAGAFVFMISSLKIPSVTDSCSYMVGAGLGAILFGPTAASIFGIIVLLLQVLLLAHGGITTLGVNTSSMATAGPLLSHLIYRICKKGNVNRTFSVFLAALLGDIFTYCVTSLQFAIVYPPAEGGIGVSAVKFLGVFAPTQLPPAIIEGILTVIIVITPETHAKPELKATRFVKEAAQDRWKE